MPHIHIKSYPKGLSQAQREDFAKALSRLVSEYLSTDEQYISIAYQEVPEQYWKAEVYDTEIAPRRAQLLKQPDYGM